VNAQHFAARTGRDKKVGAILVLPRWRDWIPQRALPSIQ
jgi:hypothetical protein